MFNVGDNVRFDYHGSLKTGVIANIDRNVPKGTWPIAHIRDYIGTIYTIGIDNVSARFQVGDTVKNLHDFGTAWPVGHTFKVDKIYSDGTLGGITATGNPGAINQMFVELVLPPIPSGTIPNITVSGNGSILLGNNNPWYNTGTWQEYAPISLGSTETKQGCSHTWKTYIGLCSKFDYCSKCDEKKKETLIYE
jgi:hypothetical protein